MYEHLQLYLEDLEMYSSMDHTTWRQTKTTTQMSLLNVNLKSLIFPMVTLKLFSVQDFFSYQSVSVNHVPKYTLEIYVSEAQVNFSIFH